jgi:hypothetical protein
MPEFNIVENGESLTVKDENAGALVIGVWEYARTHLVCTGKRFVRDAGRTDGAAPGRAFFK